MSEFPAKKPVLVHHTIEDTKYALAHESDWLYPQPRRLTVQERANLDAAGIKVTPTIDNSWLVKDKWIIGLIDEIVAKTGRDIAYNAEVKKLARERLGLPALSDAENAREGDALSRLIYNAQGYRRSDLLEAAGFVPCTQAVIDRAGVGGQLQTPTSKLFTIVVNGVEQEDVPTVYTVRDHGGTLHAFKPRKRNSCLSTNGQPVKIVKYGKKPKPAAV